MIRLARHLRFGTSTREWADAASVTVPSVGAAVSAQGGDVEDRPAGSGASGLERFWRHSVATRFVAVGIIALAEGATSFAAAQPNLPEVERAGGRFRDCPVCPELVVVPAGTIWMGTLTSETWRIPNCPWCQGILAPFRSREERPRRQVTIGMRLAVGVSEVSFAEWGACVAEGGCGGYRPDDNGWGRGARPVINVSWNDAQAYVRWLSERTGATYRLLSESEWEYVARAGTTTAWYWGQSSLAQCRHANGRDASDDYHLLKLTCSDGHAKTAPVRSYLANAFGLHDMLGNVWEWVQDCWHPDYNRAPTNGTAWTRGGNCRLRVFRGGSWWDLPDDLRAASRGRDPAGHEIGFRVARTAADRICGDRQAALFINPS